MTWKHLSRRRHRIVEHPFEAFLHGSWQRVQRLKIEAGNIIVHVKYHRFEVEEKVAIKNLRVHSRKASVSDCGCYLRPNMDVCVFSTYPSAPSSVQILQPAWHDAKIISIDRRPHEYQCTCQYSIIFYEKEDSVGCRKLKRDGGIQKVSIDDIAIIQKLGQESYKDGCHCWSFSEDCPLADKSKLSVGTFVSEVSWLLVLSILNGMKFDIRTIRSKVEYLIANVNHDLAFVGSVKSINHDDIASKDKFKNHEQFCLDSNDSVKAINFQKNDGITHPVIELIDLVVSASGIEAVSTHDELENEQNDDLNGPIELRRSKRQRVLPDRYNGHNSSPCPKRFSARLVKGTNQSVQVANHISEQNHPKEKTDVKNVAGTKDHFDGNLATQNESTSGPASDSHRNGMRTWKRAVRDREISEEAKNSVHGQKKNEKSNEIGNDFPDSGNPIYHRDNLKFSSHRSATSTENKVGKCLDGEQIEFQKNQCQKTQTKKISKANNVEFCHGHYIVRNAAENGTKLKGSNVEFQRGNESLLNDPKKKVSIRTCKRGEKLSSLYKSNYCFKRKRHGEPSIYRRKIYNASEWKQMMDVCLQNIQWEMEKQHPHVVSQWEANRVVSVQKTWWNFNWTMVEDDTAIQCLEHEDLWKDMENSMVAFHSLSTYQELSFESSAAFGKTVCEDGRQPCQHEYIMDEEIGIICQLCNFVTTEIRHVSPPFLQTDAWIRTEDKCIGDKLRCAKSCAVDTDLFFDANSLKDTISQRYESVWALVPHFKAKLHGHQKKAFEFLWKNIAGSLNPKDMECMSKNWGGCVISHSPGTGKTLLVISFLVSYLTLFPRKRPLILTPKTTLCAWYSEFEKWDVSIPIYQINGTKYCRKIRRECKINEYVKDLRQNETMMHITDCLDKLWKWHKRPSILLMSYSSFLYMARTDSKFEHRRYMARILLRSPGILILDEGHNPRSTRSKLRKVLMEVNTDLRILLSGTVFQNNFEEYFNTLCLARPTFISEMAREFNLKGNSYKRGCNAKKFTNREKEMQARRYFMEKIARKINSRVDEERKCGLSVLKRLTNRFIDVYSGGSLDRLPGLECYTILMKSMDVQQQILSKLQEFRKQKRSCLEIQLLVTLGSIHPWLVTTVASAGRFLLEDELKELDRYKHNIEKGSKVKFVVDLIYQCIVKREKVLIFCRNIPPINLFVELFKLLFGWQKDEEVLMLQGDQDLAERSKVISKFNECGGTSRVLLASTTASSEGISLTAASRVVLLDLEWNPSKTKQAIARAFRPGQERVVYVYRLLASGTLEEEKYATNDLKERQSRMIFTGGCVEGSSYRQTENICDDALRELVKADKMGTFKMIMKNEKVHSSVEKDDEELC